MKKFKLDPVLNYRKMLENVECQKLAEVQVEKRKLMNAIDEVRQKLEDYYENLEQRRNEGIVLQELMLLESNVQHHMKIFEKLTKKLSQAEKNVEDQQMVLKKASRNKKLLENLKEKFIEKEKGFLQQKEQAEVDEIAVLFHKR
jgi:flagellar protein FliJ